MHGGIGIILVREMWKEECYLCFAMKKNCVWQTHGIRKRTKEKRHSEQEEYIYI